MLIDPRHVPERRGEQDVGAGAARHQHARHVLMVAHQVLRRRRLVIDVAGIDVGAVVDEQLGNLQGRGDVQGRLAIAAAGVDRIRIGRDQLADAVDHAQPRRGVDVDRRPTLDQEACERLARVEHAEAPRPPVAARVDVGASAEQDVDHLAIAAVYGRQQRRGAELMIRHQRIVQDLAQAWKALEDLRDFGGAVGSHRRREGRSRLPIVGVVLVGRIFGHPGMRPCAGGLWYSGTPRPGPRSFVRTRPASRQLWDTEHHHAAEIPHAQESSVNRSTQSSRVRISSRAAAAAEEVASDLRYAVRTWSRRPLLCAIAVLSLAAGIGLNTAVFAIINTIFFQTVRGVPAAERVATAGPRVPFTTFREVREQARAFSGVAAWQPIGVDIRVRDLALRTAVPVVSESYFAVLDVRPAVGRFFQSTAPRRPVPEAEAVLDYEFWTGALGANPAAIGGTIAVNGVPLTIVGIAPRSFHGFGPERPPLWIPIGMKPAITASAPRWEDPAEGGWRIVGRLQDGVSVEQANAELRALAATMPAVFPNGPVQASTGAEGWSGNASAEKQIEFLLVVVLPLVVVGLILWIGCSNVANLLLARAAARRKEIAIRLANGASRARLIRFLLTESLVIAVAGALVGTVLVGWTLDFLRVTLPEFPSLAIELDSHVFVYTAGISILATIVFGLAPALHATRVDVAPLLKGDDGGIGQGGRSARLRTFFLVTQFASSIALLAVAGTFVKSVISTHVGEQSALIDRLAVAYVEATGTSPAGRDAYWRGIREELRRLPNVTSLSLTPAGSGERTRLIPEGSAPPQAAAGADVAVQRIDAEYFRTLGVAVVAGAEIVPGARAVEAVAVNERAARRFWGTTAVVGRRLALDGAPAVEVGAVVRDQEDSPRVYRTLTDGNLASAQILIRTARPSADVVGDVRAVLQRVAADRAFTRVSTFREAGLGMLQRLTRLAVIVAILVLALATVGLYGSVSFAMSQRTREIAIRVAIGAPRRAVLALLAREGVLVVAAGSAAGLVLTGVAFQFMSGMIFARWTLEPVTIAGVLGVLSLATLTACYVPGRRALRVEPSQALRGDG